MFLKQRHVKKGKLTLTYISPFKNLANISLFTRPELRGVLFLVCSAQMHSSPDRNIWLLLFLGVLRAHSLVPNCGCLVLAGSLL